MPFHNRFRIVISQLCQQVSREIIEQNSIQVAEQLFRALSGLPVIFSLVFSLISCLLALFKCFKDLLHDCISIFLETVDCILVLDTDCLFLSFQLRLVLRFEDFRFEIAWSFHVHNDDVSV